MGGTRFYSRGISKDGYVANFCETEEFIVYQTNVISHIQIRGSVPVFWQQVSYFSNVFSRDLFHHQCFRQHWNSLTNHL